MALTQGAQASKKDFGCGLMAMNEKQFKQILVEWEARRVPESLNLWPGIEEKIAALPRKQELRHTIKIALSLSFVFLMVSIMLVALSPGLQSVAAQVLYNIREMVGISGDMRGPEMFSPVPPFTVKLPGYLPQGFINASSQYIPREANLPSIEVHVERVSPGTETVEPIPLPPTSREAGNQASILIRYKSDAGQYFELFERSALPGEELPPGEEFNINENTARLARDAETLTLTWIEAGTWIELAGRLPEAELLKIASGLEVTQTPQDVAFEPQLIPGRQALEATERASFCNPEDYDVDNRINYLGNVPNQKQKSGIRIDLFFEDQYPFPATVAWGSSVVNHADEVFKPALEALKDPATQMTFLPYKAIGMYVNETGCWEPNPAIRGYFVIEVWEKQVNIGYGGDALELRERAIQALEEEMKRMP